MAMITPEYTLSQDEESISIHIRCPQVTSQQVGIAVDQTIFGFYLEPFYLPLVFPHPVHQSSDGSAKYDPSSGLVIVRLLKDQRGQHFTDLEQLVPQLLPSAAQPGAQQPAPGESAGVAELLAKGLARENETRKREGRKLLVDEGEANDEPGAAPASQASSSTFSFSVPPPGPSLSASASTEQISPPGGYGFQGRYRGIFSSLPAGTPNPVNELDNPDATAATERRNIAESNEERKWDEGIYLDNFVDQEGEIAQGLLPWRPSTGPTELSGEDASVLAEIVSSQSSLTSELSPDSMRSLHLVLVQFLFASCYDSRSTLGDPTVESCWTFCSLSRALSALDAPNPSTGDNLLSTLRASYRRALTYPLYRSWVLCDRVRRDVMEVLQAGRSAVLHHLLVYRNLLAGDEVYEVYNTIWLDPLCTWVAQQTRDEDFRALQAEMDSAATSLTKAYVGGETWDLEVIEIAARQAIEAGEGGFV